VNTIHLRKNPERKIRVDKIAVTAATTPLSIQQVQGGG